MARVPANATGKVLVGSVPCLKCGYDLRAMHTTSRCPECGARVWDSIEKVIDPDASRLPRLRDPIGVGNGLFVLALSWFLAAGFWGMVPAAHWLAGFDQNVLINVARLVPDWLQYGAGLVLLVGLWGVFRLATPSGEDEEVAVRRVLWTLGGSLLICSVLALLAAFSIRQGGSGVAGGVLELCIAATALTSMWALRRIVKVVGRRSRQWRSSKGGRQHIVGLMAVVVVVVIGSALEKVPASSLNEGSLPFEWSRLGSLIVAAGYLMLMIGLAYFVVNMWWIRKSLQDQPPPLESLIMPEAPPGE